MSGLLSLIFNLFPRKDSSVSTPDALQNLIDQAETDKQNLASAVDTKANADSDQVAAIQAAQKAAAGLDMARKKLAGTRDQLTDLVTHLYDPGAEPPASS